MGFGPSILLDREVSGFLGIDTKSLFPVTAISLKSACTAALEIEGVPARSSWHWLESGEQPKDRGFFKLTHCEGLQIFTDIFTIFTVNIPMEHLGQRRGSNLANYHSGGPTIWSCPKDPYPSLE